MKKKILLMTGIGLFLLGAVIAAALNAVLTITDVRVAFSTLSTEGGLEATALQAELEEKFIGSSTTFLNLEDARETVEKYPAFRVDEVKKEFPRTLCLTVSEREEVFAFQRAEGGFAVLDEEGRYLYDKQENVNRRLGENLLLEGFEIEAAEAGEFASGSYLSEAISFASVFASELHTARANIRSIALMPTENHIQGDYFFRIFMREGVCVDIYEPAVQIELKAFAVLDTYLGLSDAERLYGYFDIIPNATGGFTISGHSSSVPS